MIVRWFFNNGPLDGLTVCADGDGVSTTIFDVTGRSCFETSQGIPGAIIEAVNPELAAAADAEGITLRIHAYRVIKIQPFRIGAGDALVPVYVEIHAVHVAPTQRFVTFKIDRQSHSESVLVVREYGSASN
jgi:hypothetical protein